MIRFGLVAPCAQKFVTTRVRCGGGLPERRGRKGVAEEIQKKPVLGIFSASFAKPLRPLRSMLPHLSSYQQFTAVRYFQTSPTLP